MDSPVAIVGAAALLPGSPCLGDFWRTVVAGKDLMADVPASRWLIEDIRKRLANWEPCAGAEKAKQAARRRLS